MPVLQGVSLALKIEIHLLHENGQVVDSIRSLRGLIAEMPCYRAFINAMTVDN
jgi:hypothetical protein